MNKYKDDFQKCGSDREGLMALLKEKAQSDRIVLLGARNQGRWLEAPYGPLEYGIASEELAIPEGEEENLRDFLEDSTKFVLKTGYGQKAETHLLSEGAFIDLCMAKIGAANRAVRLTRGDAEKVIRIFDNAFADQNLQVICSYGRVRAVKSADYQYLCQQEVLSEILSYFDKAGWEPQVQKWQYSHDLTGVFMTFGKEFKCREMDAYNRYLRLCGLPSDEYQPAVYVRTSDSGNSSVSLDVCMKKKDSRTYVLLGDGIRMPHLKGMCSLGILREKMPGIMAAARGLYKNLEALAHRSAEYPGNCARNIGNALKINARALEESVKNYYDAYTEEYVKNSTYHDVYFIVQDAIDRMLDNERISIATVEKARIAAARMLTPQFDWAYFDAEVVFKD